MKEIFKKKKIFYKQKFGKNKANYAENAIYIVKKKLYMLLRGTLSHDWVSSITKVVKSYNNTPNKKLGWLKPNTINSVIDSVQVEEAQKQHNIDVYREPNFKEQILNQEQYEKDSKSLQVGQYVYLDFDQKLFSKSFDVQVIFGY